MIPAVSEFSGIGYTKLQKFSSLLSLKIPQRESFYERRRQLVFPEIDAARQKNQLEQIEEIKPSVRMLELALDGQCDSPGCKVTYNTVSATDTATNKLIIFRVVYVKVWNYVYETTHYVCAFCFLHAQYQFHDISLIASKNTEIQWEL